MGGIPKITKSGKKRLTECKKGQIVKFPTTMAQGDVAEIAEEFGFNVWFFEPGDMEYNKHGRNVIKLLKLL